MATKQCTECRQPIRGSRRKRCAHCAGRIAKEKAGRRERARRRAYIASLSGPVWRDPNRTDPT